MESGLAFGRCHSVVGNIATLQAVVFILSDTPGVAMGWQYFSPSDWGEVFILFPSRKILNHGNLRKSDSRGFSFLGERV
ncbi:MAG: hypothetical protein ACI9S8_001480 [Chlamydiales bacterium]|jgi:hypothetical protein